MPGTAMLIQRENILERFVANLAWASEIDLATAWATGNAGLRALRERSANRSSPLQVRAVVGLWGNLTEPAALRSLDDMRALRVADRARLFHPKVFLFRGAGRSLAWIGSANFTGGGFGRNEEAVIETADTAAVECWFERLWEQCGPLPGNTIKDYAAACREHPPRFASLVTGKPDGEPVRAPLQLLDGVNDWRSYVKALERCDRWWAARHTWSVLGNRGEKASWSRTIRELRELARRKDWREFSDADQKRLLGLKDKHRKGEGWELLGNMRSSARVAVFGASCEAIRDVVLRVAEADDGAFPDVAVAAYTNLVDKEKFPGIGRGRASRLLTLARPERVVSLNGQSEAGLADFSGLPTSSLGKPAGYGRLLETLYDRAWFRAPPPEDPWEQAIWSMRAALLDCFVYKSD